MNNQRTLAKRQHRLLAMHLALCCWLRQKDAVILERSTFTEYLGLERVKLSRVYQFEHDVKTWFPFSISFYLTKKEDSFSSIILSRIEIPQVVKSGSKSMDERVEVASGVGFLLARSKELSHRYPTILEKDVVAELAVWASGLDDPTLNSTESDQDNEFL